MNNDFLPIKGSVICRLPDDSANSATWGLFSNPYDIIQTSDVSEIKKLISEVSKRVKSGDYAAGFMTYEAGAAFDDAHVVHDTNGETLLWFAIYDHPPQKYSFTEPNLSINQTTDIDAILELSNQEYLSKVDHVLNYIKEGDIYQANFTFRSKLDKKELLGSLSSGEFTPYHLFQKLTLTHPVPYAAYLNSGDQEIVSISPELFLEKNGDILRSMPMKGTAHRKLNATEDSLASINLSNDKKNCAENVMIVDMVRNDFGRICELGSVKVDPLFHVDTYKTVHQMVSNVQCKVKKNISFLDILTATFPAASITGAPKIRAMEIINELENSPRKVYTGMIGCITPSDSFCFNVAIRTLICQGDSVELGIGSGIVADSSPIAEWNESILKSTFVTKKNIEFELLETILWRHDGAEPDNSSLSLIDKNLIFLLYLDDHLERLRSSHLYFGWSWNRDKIIQKILLLLEQLLLLDYARLRLRTSQKGEMEIDIIPLEYLGWKRDEIENLKIKNLATGNKVWIGNKLLQRDDHLKHSEKARPKDGPLNPLVGLKVSSNKTNSKDLFLYHKTTNREFYNREFKEALKGGFDEVIFMNEKNEITECAISNIFIYINNQWFTPPIKCGLLDGIWRKNKILELNSKEKVLFLDDLKNADKILIGNSVRGEALAFLSYGL